MPIVSPTAPSAVNSVSPVQLQPTQNNRAFYVYSGRQTFDENETTLVSIADIGKRDIFIAIEVGFDMVGSDDVRVAVKSNGTEIFAQKQTSGTQSNNYGFDEIRLTIPANTSLEVTLQNITDSSNLAGFIAGYGTYLE